MAMIRVAPVNVEVRTDWFNGTPREVTWGTDRMPITRVVAIRDERSAYPAITGSSDACSRSTRRRSASPSPIAIGHAGGRSRV